MNIQDMVIGHTSSCMQEVLKIFLLPSNLTPFAKFV